MGFFISEKCSPHSDRLRCACVNDHAHVRPAGVMYGGAMHLRNARDHETTRPLVRPFIRRPNAENLIDSQTRLARRATGQIRVRIANVRGAPAAVHLWQRVNASVCVFHLQLFSLHHRLQDAADRSQMVRSGVIHLSNDQTLNAALAHRNTARITRPV